VNVHLNSFTFKPAASHNDSLREVLNANEIGNDWEWSISLWDLWNSSKDKNTNLHTMFRNGLSNKMKCTPNSPDLNPIPWDALDQQVRSMALLEKRVNWGSI